MPSKLSTILTIPELRERIENRSKIIYFCSIHKIEYNNYCPKCRECHYRKRKEACEEQERIVWRQLREAKKNNFDAYLKACGVPKIFQAVKPPPPPTGGALVKQADFQGCSLFLTGGFGTGKTYKAVSILKGYVKNLHCGHFVEPFKDTPVFITVPELLLKIRSCYNSTDSEESVLKVYFDTPLLVLDDLGAEKTTEWALQSLYVIINKRLSEEQQTIITSNLSLDELREKIGDRIVSRIAGLCKVIKLTGKDRRLIH